MRNAVSPASDRMMLLDRRVARLQRLVLGLVILVVLAAAWMVRIGHSETALAADRVLRVRGLVVEDQSGRARILLGAPTPDVPERLRKDATTALVVLNETGTDRLILGYGPNPMVNGKVYKRESNGVGMLIHDAQGTERAGFGVADIGKVTMSLDRPTGDAVAMVVDDRSGFAGLVVAYPNPIGSFTQAAGLYTVGKEVALRLDDRNEMPRFQLQLKENAATELSAMDEKGTTVASWPGKHP